MKLKRPLEMTAIVSIVVLYVAVRFWHLTDSCLWFDEIFSIHATEHSWRDLLQFVALDLIHPPLFYVFLKLWIGIGGESVFWLRLFPVLFSIAALFPLIALLRELKQSKWVEVLTLFLITVNGSLLKYSQEVRMYSMLMCISLISMWLFSIYFVKGKSFLPLVIVNILLVYTHYFGWFVVASEVAAIMIFQRIKWSRIVAMFAITVVGFIPWIITLSQAAKTGSGLGQNIGWMSRPGFLSIIQFKLGLIEPFYYPASSIDPVSIYRISIPLMLIFTTAFVLYLVSWKRQTDEDKRAISLMYVFVALPVIMAFVASWLLPYSIWGLRHLIVVFVPVSIVLAIVIVNIYAATTRLVAITLILLFSGYGLVLHAISEKQQFSWCAWEPLAAETEAANNLNIYTFEDLVAYHIWFGERNNSSKPQIAKVTDIDGIVEDKAYFLPRGFDEVGKISFAKITEPRLWIAYRSKNINPSEPPLRNFLVKGYQVVNQREIAAGGESAIFLLLEK